MKAKKSLPIGFIFTTLSDVLPELRLKYYYFNHTTRFLKAWFKSFLCEHFYKEKIIENCNKANYSWPVTFIFISINDALPELTEKKNEINNPKKICKGKLKKLQE